jgi:hypothetical protein
MTKLLGYGLMAAFLACVVGTGAGLYAGRRLADLLD